MAFYNITNSWFINDHRSLHRLKYHFQKENIFLLSTYMSLYWCKSFLSNIDRLSLTNNRWYHPSLRYACDWLQQNNPYLSAYNSIASHLLAHNSQNLLSGLKQFMFQ